MCFFRVEGAMCPLYGLGKEASDKYIVTNSTSSSSSNVEGSCNFAAGKMRNNNNNDNILLD